MLMGLPGCGKSTFAKELQKSGAEIFSSDTLREETGITDNEKLFKILHENIMNAVKEGKDAVYDATNLSRKRRISFLKEIRHAYKEIYCFASPLSVCKKQNLLREEKWQVPDHVYNKFIRTFQMPDKYEGWDNVSFRFYEGDFEPAFSFEESINMNQENHHHKLTLGEHLLESEQYAIKNGLSKELRIAAKYHDIGKPITKSFYDSRGNLTKEAHYYGHDCASAYIFLSEFYPKIAEMSLSVEEFLYVANLINWHMRPYLVWDKEEGKKATEKDRQLIGEQMFNDILLLHEADKYAH